MIRVSSGETAGPRRNIKVGLPFIGTSVDHGTAVDIAGSGRADHSSRAYAFRQACSMIRARRGETAGPDAPRAPSTLASDPIFIFMLTHRDRTVPDARELLPQAIAAGVRHIGFKDIGLRVEDLRILADDIRAAGGKVYLEVVSLDEDSERASANVAVELGVDVLMGGTRPEVVLPVLRGTGIRYYPFPGRIVGHPSRLEGSVNEIVDHARMLASMDGVHGLDLLAYRFEGDVGELVRSVCSAVPNTPVIAAGSIDRAERVATVLEAGVTGFTVGTAALDGAFPVGGALQRQLAYVSGLLAAYRQRPRGPHR